jgi:hypothetical protein
MKMKWYEYFLYLWCLPQFLLCLIVMCFIKDIKFDRWYRGRPVFVFDRGASKINDFFSGTALFWTLLPSNAGMRTIGHEHGHHIQGNKWGLIYLPVIGIASLRNNLKARNCERTKENYYDLYPEAEADELGNVVWVNGVRVYQGN